MLRPRGLPLSAASRGGRWQLQAARLAAADVSGRSSAELAPQAESASPPASASNADASLYPGHIKLSALQKSAVAVLSAVGAALNPARADLVAALGETTGHAALRNMHKRMLASATGREILSVRPRITDAVLQGAHVLPPGTFGAAYASFMGARRFSPAERPPVRFVDDPDLAYVAQRAREVHDLWHVLFGCPTSVLGELALKAVEYVQTGMPMAGLSVLGGPVRLKPAERARLLSELLPWALSAGSRSADLMCLFYERHFEEDLADVRQRWRIRPAPAL